MRGGLRKLTLGAGVGFEPTISALWGRRGRPDSSTLHYISGSFTSLTTRLAFYFGERGLTENSQLDYPHWSEFSDDSFSFSVISFYIFSTYFACHFIWVSFLNRLCCSISLTRISLRTPRLSAGSSLVGIRAFLWHYPYILYRWGDMVIPAGFEPSITALKGLWPDH